MSKVAKVRNITESTLVKTGAGTLRQVIITSHTSGTMKLYDYLSATGTVLIPTTTFGATEREITFDKIPFSVGLYVELGGTAAMTILYD